MRSFDTGDAATDFNLSRLSHLSEHDSFDGDAGRMHDWLVAVIQSIEMLPKAVGCRFRLHDYQIGDLHYQLPSDRRSKLWRELVQKLKQRVDAVAADPVVRRDGPNGPPDLSDRPQTRGERIIDLCKKLDSAPWSSPDFERILAAIEQEAAFGIRADVAELRRLVRKKRIKDLSEHTYWVIRHLSHIREIARQMHHLS